MLMKTNLEKMSVLPSLAMLLKTHMVIFSLAMLMKSNALNAFLTTSSKDPVLHWNGKTLWQGPATVEAMSRPQTAERH